MRKLLMPMLLCILLAVGCASAVSPPEPDGTPEPPPTAASASTAEPPEADLPEAQAPPAAPEATPRTGVYLDIAEAVYSLRDEGIPYGIVNATGGTVYVLLIPTLERRTASGWEAVPCGAGFCGVPDSIAPRWDDLLPLSWYDGLTEGDYRLSFNIVDGTSYEAKGSVEAEFRLEAEAVRPSMALAESGPGGAVATLTNPTDAEWTYGSDFCVSRMEGAAWTPVEPIIENAGFDSIGYILPAGESAQVEIDWRWIYGELPPGYYRLDKEALYVRAPGDYDKTTLWAAFEVE